VSNYSIGDAITRYKLMQGYNVMQPMGYDAFGMPAENYAIMHNSHPKITTEENINIMRGQFNSMGFGLDWDREVSTCRPGLLPLGTVVFSKDFMKKDWHIKEIICELGVKIARLCLPMSRWKMVIAGAAGK